MTTLIGLVDLVVLLLYVASIPRFVSKWQSQGPGPLFLSVFIAVVIAIFAVVSFIANAGLVAASSSFTQAIILLFLVVMAALARASWANKPTA